MRSARRHGAPPRRGSFLGMGAGFASGNRRCALEPQLQDAALIRLGHSGFVVFNQSKLTRLGQMAEQVGDVSADGCDFVAFDFEAGEFRQLVEIERSPERRTRFR